jgi:hypothetical protein
MSSSISMKPISKPLKGQIIQTNYGSFDTLQANNLQLESISIAGVFEDGIFVNITIKDSQITNTVIGADTPSMGYFTSLQAYNSVLFNSNVMGSFFDWNHETATLNLGNSTFRVRGCSYLGNLRICENFIRATNLNGDVEIIPNGGSVYLNGPVYNVSTHGSFYMQMTNGGATVDVKNNILLQSTSGSSTISTFNGQTYTSVNGDISLITEPSLLPKFMSLTNTSSGITTITTLTDHNLKSGNVITVNSTGSIDSAYTVGNILSSKSFTITNTSVSVSNLTIGSLLKTASNNINLNTRSLVTIPENIKLTFGATSNSISGNTNGLIVSSRSDVAFNLSSDKSVLIPTNTQLHFASSNTVGNYITTGNYINYNGSSINIAGTNSIIQSGLLSQINTTNTRFYDPILTIGDYTLTSADNKDRGVEYRYLSSSGSMKLGWFGYKSNTNKFTFIPDATNTDEIISGTPGEFAIGDISANNITLVTGGNFDLSCGHLLNVRRMTGCGGEINLLADNNLNITSGNRITLGASGDIYVPYNIPITIGTSGSSIREETTGNLRLAGARNITISTGSVIIPVATYLSFDGTSIGSQSISSNTSGDLLIDTNKNLYLTTTGGNIVLPSGISSTSASLQFGNTSEYIYGNTTGVFMVSNSPSGTTNLIATSNVNISSSSGDINLYSANANVRLLNNRRLVFGSSGTSNSIYSNTSGNLVIDGNGSASTIDFKNTNEINLSANNSVNMSTGTVLYLSSDRTRSISSDNFNNLNIINAITNGNTNITTANLNIINSSNGVTSISTSNLTITGTTGSIINFNTQNVKFKDPIISLANYNLSTNDAKDRGIEYDYLITTSGSMRTGWFGWKNTSQRFTYYSNAVNTGEIISGTVGSAEFDNLYLKNNVFFENPGQINMNCGTIANLNTITGCSGTINIVATSNTNVSSNNIMLLAGTKVQLPYNIPLSFGNTANSISSDSNGNMTITTLSGEGNIVFNGNIQVNGTTSTIYSTVTNLQDPIFSIGGITGPIVNDTKDRGIEFKWNNGNGVSGSKVGFFGYKNSLGRFVFIQDGINLYEVFYGSYGNVQFGDGYFNNLDLQNGTISNVNTISGGRISIIATSGNLNLSSGNINIPFNSNLNFGSTTNSVFVTTSGNLTVKAANDINVTSQTGSIYLNTNTSGTSSVNISNNTPLYFGSQTSGSYITRSTSGDLNITNSSGDINLTPNNSTGTILLPVNTILSFGSTSDSILSNGEQLLINGYNGIGINTSNFTISGNVNIIGTVTSKPDPDSDLNRYILPLGTSQYLDITEIVNYSNTTAGNIKITVASAHNFRVGDSILLRNTDSAPKLDDTFTVSGIISTTEFLITNPDQLTQAGTEGAVKSNLMTFQGKDVGIQVNYWSTVGNLSVTSGSLGYKTGFFGFKNSSERWVYYKNATVSNNIVSGTLSDIEVDKVFANRLSGYTLEGAISAGSNAILGNNFQISGGNINSTPIGVNVPQTGKFTNLSNTVAASLQNVTMTSSLVYSIDRYSLSSGFAIRAPLLTSIVSVFSVTSPNFYGAMGTIGSNSLSIADGTMKIIVCGSMATGSTYTLHFGANKLIAPNPINTSIQPSKIIFKRQGQCAKLLFDAQSNNSQGSWILLTGGVYVE